MLGEDMQKMQMIDPIIVDNPSTQGMRKLAFGTVTIGKKKKLPLKGEASGNLMKQILGIFYRFLGDTS